ncbi:MAG: TRAP transporter substrate-binding protein [Pararhodobacter sp.]|nr:TRAP transporter substrate-binding protein [Pararhodobacter sp.]
MTRLTTTTLAAVTAAALALPAAAQNFDLQSAYGLRVPGSGPGAGMWAERVERATGGEISFTVHGAGDIVPPLEVFGAVSSGAIPFGYDWAGYWGNQIPVAALLGGMPWGPEPELYTAWLYNGGGLDLMRRIMADYNVHVIPCQMVLQEAAGWFNREINTVEDLRGLNMRFAGLGAEVMARLGVNTQLIPAGEIYVSLERGRIDATEFSSPTLDVGLGFQNVAQYYYFPGWHQPSSVNSIIVHMPVWEAFSEDQQTIMEDACKANILEITAEQVHSQIDALEVIEEAGVEIRMLPDEVMSALRVATDEVMAERSAADPLFAEVYESLSSYIERTSRWYTLQVLPR